MLQLLQSKKSLVLSSLLALSSTYAEETATSKTTPDLETAILQELQLQQQDNKEKHFREKGILPAESGSDFGGALVTPITPNPTPTHSKPRKKDDKSDEEEEKDPSRSWLLDGVMKLSGQYKEEELPGQQTASDSEQEKFYSSTLLIDQMSEYMQDKREEQPTSQGPELAEEETSWLEALEADRNRAELKLGSQKKDAATNPFLQAMRLDDWSSSKTNGQNSAQAKQSGENNAFTSSLLNFTDASTPNSSNPYLQALQQTRAPRTTVQSTLPSPPTQAPKFAPLPQAKKAPLNSVVVEKPKRQYVPQEKIEKKYFRNLSSF